MLGSLQQYYNNKDINKIMRTTYSVVAQSLIKGNIQILKYMLDEVIGEQNMKCFFDNLGSDLILDALSNKSATLEIIVYLHSIYKRHHKLEKDSYLNYYTHSPRSGKLEIVKWFDDILGDTEEKKISIDSVTQVFSRAVSSGSADIVEWILSKNNRIILPNGIWEDALKSGSIDLLNFMISVPNISKSFDRESLFEDGVLYGRRHVIEWLYKQNCTIHTSVSYIVDKNDSPEFIDWIFHFFKSIGVEDAMQFGLSFEWYCYYTKKRNYNLFYSSSLPMPNTLDSAILNGHLNILKWLHTNQIAEQCSPYYLIKAHYINDNLELIQWLFENRTERCTEPYIRFSDAPVENQRFMIHHYTELVPEQAFFHHDMFEYVIRNYPQFIQGNSLIVASYYGNVEMVKIIHNKIFKDYHQQQHSSTSNSSSTNNDSRHHLTAAENDLKVIQHSSLEEAIFQQHLVVLQFLFENAVIPIESNLNDKDYLMDCAIRSGNLQIIRYLHNNTICKLDSESSKMILNDLSDHEISSLASEKKKRTYQHINN